jgi:molybdenum cofactor cytidylyltransferase/nicotine blue oxidoreductase
VIPSRVIAVAVLAAGRSTRFGGDTPKQLAPLGGRPLVAHALAAARASGVGPVMAVVSDDRVHAAIDPGVEVLRNDAPEAGIASSLQVVLHAVTARDTVEAVIVGLADQPLVGPDAYRRIAIAYDEGARLAVATYGGARGNPVLLARPFWPEALGLAGDVGARVLLQRHDATDVPCDGTGDPTDVDTPQDLAVVEARWTSTTASE